jgi:hypothetical protein
MNDHSMFRNVWYGRSRSAGQARSSIPAIAALSPGLREAIAPPERRGADLRRLLRHLITSLAELIGQAASALPVTHVIHRAA